MSDILFQRAVKVDGVLTDADSTPTIQITRLDTSAVVVATTITGVTHPSTGNYQYTLASVVPGVTYRAIWTFLVAGQTIVSPKDVVAHAASADWYYADQEDVEDLIATENLQIVSNLDNDDTEMDTARIQRGGEWADAYMDSYLRGLYTVPLVGMDDATTLLMADISARLVAWWLYQKRGVREASTGQTVQKSLDILFANHKDIADKALLRYRGGLDVLVATRITTLPTSGIAIGTALGTPAPDGLTPFPFWTG